MSQWDELKRLAESATLEGDWYNTKTVDVFPEFSVDQEYMLAASPESILALIARNEWLQEIANEQRHRLEFLCEGTDGSTPALVRIARLEEERDQLRAEVEALRKDAERYRWMRDHPVQVVVSYCGAACDEWIDSCIEEDAHP